MAKQIEGVYDRVLECAKEEFLEKGYKDASLRNIAKAAGTSTGSIYTRFGDKDGLFSALVEPVASMVTGLSTEIVEEFQSLDMETKMASMAEFSIRSHVEVIDYIYDNDEMFILLLNCAHGSSFGDFMDRLVELEETSTRIFLKDAGRDDLLDDPVISDFIHILSTTYCCGIFEPLLHGMSREKAHQFDGLFTKYHTAGFEALFDREKGGL